MKSSSKAKPKGSVADLKSASSRAKKSPTKHWRLRLYVAGQTPRSLAAFANLKTLCELHLPGRYKIEVIDLVKEPHRAQVDEIVALPTLVRKLPVPIKRVIGDLSNLEKTLVGLDLQVEPKGD